jgi:hypothetical protein
VLILRIVRKQRKDSDDPMSLKSFSIEILSKYEEKSVALK